MKENKFISWGKSHKKQVALTTGISIAAPLIILLAMKNKDSIEEVWKTLKDEIEKIKFPIYSDKWFEHATNSELSIEREKIRNAYCSSDDFDMACRLQNLLGIFDNEMSRRAWGTEVPHTPSVHREHGWYLPNDD